MKLPSVSLSLFALLPYLAHSVLASDVLDLTGATFNAEVMGADLALVEFFAPWCGHCKNLAPHYEEAATELKNKKGGIKLAKVDCTENQELCSEYGVQGYPTLKVFRNGTPTDYGGPRKADGIVSYMVKQSLPAVSEVTKASHDEFIKEDKVVVVAYGADGSAIPQAFLDYANEARDDFLFGKFIGSDVPSLPEGASLPAIVLYKQFDEGHVVLPSSSFASLTSASLGEFVKGNSLPLFDEITPENFGTYAGQGVPIGYLFVDPEDADAVSSLVSDLSPLAKEHRGKINFVYIDAVKFVDHGKSLNLPGDVWPGFVVQDLAAQTKYPLVGVATKENVGDFVAKFVKGEIAASIKSEPVPESQGPVYKLVADDWDNLINDSTKDVFAEFFAPWCGHCQRLAPVWESLGEKFASNSNIVIAQMDATLNDVPPQAGFRVQGFPTIKFRAAGSGEWIDYNGDRSLESLVEFVQDNSASEPASAGGAEGSAVVEEDEAEEAEEDAVPDHDEL